MRDPRLSSEPVYQGRVITLRKDVYQNPEGKPYTRFVLEHDPAVVIVPVLDDGRVVLVHQYRHSVGKYLYEFPAGLIDLNEDPEVAAHRELAEETGYRAASMRRLTGGFPAPGFCDEYLHFYLAEGLTLGSQNLDEDEVLEPLAVSFAELGTWISEGKVEDIKTMMIYLYLCRFGQDYGLRL